MKTLQVSAVINAPRNFVFDAFTDFDKSARILHEATRVDFQTENQVGLGVEWVQERNYPDEKSKIIARHKITAFNPPTSYVMTTDDKSSFETMTFEFTDDGSKTAVSFRLETKIKSFPARIAALLMGGLVKTFMQEDLNRMKAHIEGQYTRSM